MKGGLIMSIISKPSFTSNSIRNTESETSSAIKQVIIASDSSINSKNFIECNNECVRRNLALKRLRRIKVKRVPMVKY